MRQSRVPINEFKSKCIDLLDDVADKGRTIIITKRGRPIAKVTPVAQPVKPLRGSWKGLVKVKGDIVHFSGWDETQAAYSIR